MKNNDVKFKGCISQNYDNYITIIFFSFLITTLIYNIFYEGGNKFLRIMITIASICGVRYIFKHTFLCKSRFTYIATVSFMMVSMYLGNILNAYAYIPFYDKLLHFVSGILIGIISVVIYLHFTGEYFRKLNPNFILFFSLIFVIASAGGWEIWEFCGDKIFGLQSQFNSLNDTMIDMICGTVGGMISYIPIYKYFKGDRNWIISLIINEIMIKDDK